ncbi:MAG: VWA domain-containing protein, partial [Halobaculum sp.]
LAEDYERAAERIEEAVTETDVDRIPMRRPPTGEWDGSDRWQEIRRDGERLGRIFDQRLQNERRSERRRGRRRGRLDPRSLPRLARNDPRVFRSDDEPDEKEYAMVLVLDRSGSMSKTIGVAERAVATLAQALESVGVETCLVEMYRSSARIAVPFTVETAAVPEAVLTGETSGGTPLAEVLAIAREYVARTDGDPAMITVTDGKPSDEVAYREQLRQTPFPVLGVYVDPSARSHRRAAARHDDSAPFYDQRRIVVDPAELSETLERLAREVMF